jgi:Mn2+/Fe2+ NRAMP family transporter
MTSSCPQTADRPRKPVALADLQATGRIRAAAGPSLVILAVGTDVGRALIYSQVALSFGIPFALVPLLVISRDRPFLGVSVSNGVLTALLACLTGLVTSLNIFLLYQALRH